MFLQQGQWLGVISNNSSIVKPQSLPLLILCLPKQLLAHLRQV